MTLEINETELFKSLQQPSQSTGSGNLPGDIKSDYHPSDGQLALLANHAYSSLEATVPSDWRVLATATAPNGYDGVLYWHAENRQVVVAHRGTEPPLPLDNSEEAKPQRYWFNAFGRVYDYVGDKVQSTKKQLERVVPTVKDLSTDFFGVSQGAEVSQIESSLDFTQQALKKLGSVDVLSFSVTGHSLGGWLAQLTTYEARLGGLIADNVGYNLDLHCVVFDSPGAKTILEANERMMGDDFKTDLKTQLDITTYLSAPNLVNTCNAHVGTRYRIFPDFSGIDRSTIKGWGSYLLHAHTMDNFCRFFTESEVGFPNKLKQVKEWPQVDWTKMEMTKRSALHALFRVFTNRATGIESLAATLANVDYRQFEVVQQFCRVDDEQETLNFPKQYSMVRQGHYSLGKLEQDNTVIIPLRAFGVDIHNVLTGFNAYSALVKSGLLDREDEALVGLTSLKVSLETRLGADSLRMLAALAPHCSLGEQALVLNTDSASVFGITQDNMHKPAWLRRLQYQVVQVVRQIFLIYPDLSIALHEAYLGVPSDILDAHQMLKDAFSRLEKELQTLKAAKSKETLMKSSIVGTSGKTNIEKSNTHYGHEIESQTGYEKELGDTLEATSKTPLPKLPAGSPLTSVVGHSDETNIEEANTHIGHKVKQKESQKSIMETQAKIAQQNFFKDIPPIWKFQGVECKLNSDAGMSRDKRCYEVKVIFLKFSGNKLLKDNVQAILSSAVDDAIKIERANESQLIKSMHFDDKDVVDELGNQLKKLYPEESAVEKKHLG